MKLAVDAEACGLDTNPNDLTSTTVPCVGRLQQVSTLRDMPGPETCVTLARVSALGIEVHDSKYLVERVKRYFTHGSSDAKHQVCTRIAQPGLMCPIVHHTNHPHTQIKFSISTELKCPNIDPAYRWIRVPVSPFNGNDVDLRAHIAMPFIYMKKRFVTPKRRCRSSRCTFQVPFLAIPPDFVLYTFIHGIYLPVL
jgi:hypothetical protein